MWGKSAAAAATAATVVIAATAIICAADTIITAADPNQDNYDNDPPPAVFAPYIVRTHKSFPPMSDFTSYYGGCTVLVTTGAIFFLQGVRPDVGQLRGSRPGGSFGSPALSHKWEIHNLHAPPRGPLQYGVQEVR